MYFCDICSYAEKAKRSRRYHQAGPQLEELVPGGTVECNAEDDNKNDKDGAMGGDEDDEEDDNEEDDEEESCSDDQEDDKGNDGDGKKKEDNDDGKEKEDDEGREKLGAAVMFLSDDDTSSSDSVSPPTPPPPSKKIPKSQGKKTKTGKKVTNKHPQGNTLEESCFFADGRNGVVEPAGALPAASGTATSSTRRKETRPRVCSKCHQPRHNARSCQTANQK